MRDAWQEIADERLTEFWQTFYERFDFRPGVASDTWPAIREPVPSVTIDLAPAFTADLPFFAASQQAVNALALAAMVRITDPDVPLVVLDWQHPGYWFWPHREATAHSTEPRPVEVFPNGDYYIFATEDLTAGTFGHPWERTLCVFGEPFVRVLAPMLTSWLPVKRETR